MGERSYTVMILPGSRAKVWRVKLRGFAVWGILGFLAISIATTVLLPIVVHKGQRQARELAALREENDQLKQASAEIAKIRERLVRFEDQATKFALMAGVEDLPTAQGVGGLRPMDPPELESELDNLDERSDVLGRSFDVLNRVYRDQSLLLSSTPSIAPVKGMTSYGFGWRRDPFTGQRAFHKGVDLVTRRGTAVLAPAEGIVVKASRYGGYGNVVYLSHGNGLTTRYAHLEKFAVKPGQKVKRGDVLGYVGSTGRSLGAHLHYEVLVNNTRVNPVQYILDDDFGF
ncbi:MAG: peptidoglycan DD-metalloendopeptidase family protein [Acidobacteriota bacterium]